MKLGPCNVRGRDLLGALGESSTGCEPWPTARTTSQEPIQSRIGLIQFRQSTGLSWIPGQHGPFGRHGGWKPVQVKPPWHWSSETGAGKQYGSKMVVTACRARLCDRPWEFNRLGVSKVLKSIENWSTAPVTLKSSRSTIYNALLTPEVM